MKSIRSLSATAALLVACSAPARPVSAQQATAPAELQKQVEALRAQVAVMQRDLDEIKDLLAPLRARQPSLPADAVIDLGDRPVKGHAAAKVTMVELTDYQ